MPNPWFTFIADYMKKNPKLTRKEAIIEITKKGLYKKCGASKTCAKKEKKLKPCKSNQYRNPETNRCKKKPLKPCPPGKKRNPKTNRCKKIVVKESAKPKPKPKPKPKRKECKETHERDEDTGRCLKKCPPGKRRNVETKRCRKVKEDEEPEIIYYGKKPEIKTSGEYHNTLYQGVESLAEFVEETTGEDNYIEDVYKYDNMSDEDEDNILNAVNAMNADELSKFDTATLERYLKSLERLILFNVSIIPEGFDIVNNVMDKIINARFSKASKDIEETLKDIEKQAPINIEDVTGQEEDEPYDVEEYVTEGEPLRPVVEKRKWEPEKVYEEYDVSPEQLEELGKGDDSPQLLLEYVPEEEPYYEEDYEDPYEEMQRRLEQEEEPELETWEPPSSVPDKPIWDEEEEEEEEEYYPPEIIESAQTVKPDIDYAIEYAQTVKPDIDYAIVEHAIEKAKTVMPPQEYEILEEHIDKVEDKIEDIDDGIDYNIDLINAITDSIKTANVNEKEELQNELNEAHDKINKLENDKKISEVYIEQILEDVVTDYPEIIEDVEEDYPYQPLGDIEEPEEKDYDIEDVGEEEYDVSPEQIEELAKGDESPQLLLEYIPEEEPYYEEEYEDPFDEMMRRTEQEYTPEKEYQESRTTDNRLYTLRTYLDEIDEYTDIIQGNPLQWLDEQDQKIYKGVMGSVEELMETYGTPRQYVDKNKRFNLDVVNTYIRLSRQLLDILHDINNKIELYEYDL
jgi:hypothetical protein